MKSPLELDKGISLKLKSIIKNGEFISGNQLNRESVAKIYSNSVVIILIIKIINFILKVSFFHSKLSNLFQEIFENNQVNNNPGYIQSSLLKSALNSSGYDVDNDLLETIISKYKNKNNTIHLEDYVKIIIIIYNKISKYIFKKMKKFHFN